MSHTLDAGKTSPTIKGDLDTRPLRCRHQSQDNHPCKPSNFREARNKTRERMRRIQATGQCRLPSLEPSQPPTSTAAIQTRREGFRRLETAAARVRLKPRNPKMELIRMKTTDVAAACRVVHHPARSKSGVRKMPPPVPVRPASSPRAAPLKTRRRALGCFRDSGSLTEAPRRMALKTRTMPTVRWNQMPGRLSQPPKKDAGIASR